MTDVFHPSASGPSLLCTPPQHLEASNACVLSLFRHSNSFTSARIEHLTPLCYSFCCRSNCLYLPVLQPPQPRSNTRFPSKHATQTPHSRRQADHHQRRRVERRACCSRCLPRSPKRSGCMRDPLPHGDSCPTSHHLRGYRRAAAAAGCWSTPRRTRRERAGVSARVASRESSRREL